MDRQKLQDVIVVLPGIGGSTLFHGDDPIWSPTASEAYRVIRGAKALELIGESGDPAKLAGGVMAKTLISDIHILPGLWKIDGYNGLVGAIEKTFLTARA